MALIGRPRRNPWSIDARSWQPSQLSCSARDAVGAVIPVTTVEQKISATGGCSLQEAIFSANFDNNVAIARYNGATPVEVTTQCVPGNGDDIIVLPAGALLQLSKIVDDHINPTGPTATPIITSNITIVAYGATLQRTGSQNFRLFSVGSTGHLTLRRAYIRGFRAQGGHGVEGGGGGMGAGGAIYVMGGVLVVERSTFEGNSALGGKGGNSATSGGGGGGGIGGSGGPGSTGGGGGGGARGNGGGGAVYGAGGGGTVLGGAGGATRRGGFDCGGDGGFESPAGGGRCPGGGGGGGGDDFTFEPIFDAKEGGDGHYGGGGGGGADHGTGSGGHGGFGGGGGAASSTAAFDAADGGDGGFGGGGGEASIAATGPDGDAGDGGFFAGNGSNGNSGGGGGAGLGGAIFNDSGTVDVRNGTFAANIIAGGISAEGQDGLSGGGAIFSRNGHLTVLNTTISGHLSGNVTYIGAGILVAQDSEHAPTSFTLLNSIVANNGDRECAITGFTIGVAFAGNLIVSNADGSEVDGKTFVGCEGVVTSSDPQLGPLEYNQSVTPTMAIGSTSPAWNAADPGSSLAIDQRRQDRPAMGGFDIGAFELCLQGFGKLQSPCLILAGVDESGQVDQTVQLSIDVNPLGGGNTIPAPGTQQVLVNSVVALKATPNAGFRFSGWSPNVTNPAHPSTTVFMNASQTVTANFAACSCATDVSGSISVVRGSYVLNPVTRRYAQTVTLTNTSATIIAAPISLVLDALASTATLYNATGVTQDILPAGRPYINANASLGPGQRVSITLQFTAANTSAISYDARVLAGPGSR